MREQYCKKCREREGSINPANFGPRITSWVHTQSENIVSKPLQKVEEHEKRTFLPLRTYVAGGKGGGGVFSSAKSGDWVRVCLAWGGGGEKSGKV